MESPYKSIMVDVSGEEDAGYGKKLTSSINFVWNVVKTCVHQ